MFTPHFTLATLKTREGHVAAMRIGDVYWPIAACARSKRIAGLDADLHALFAVWPKTLPLLKKLASAIESGGVKAALSVPARRARLDTPLRYPHKIFCVGANYADHLAEMNASSIKKVPGVAPFFFMKPSPSVLSGPGDKLEIPRGCENLDWEAEVVVVFGRGGKNIKPENALKHIAGYTLGIDFTARDLFMAPESFFKFNFILGKCQDGLSPVGPEVVPAAFVNGEDYHFSLSVNGAVKQSSSTKHMIYSLAEQIAGVSAAVTIEPGDLMFTGSPAGVGLPRGERLHSGDKVVIEGEAIGAMQVEMRAAK